jgi:mono/diheme cytochrome c family protein
MASPPQRAFNERIDGGIFAMTQRTLRLFVTTAAAAIVAMGSGRAADEAASYFRQNCISCHTIGGGRLVGPDLKDVTQRKERAWLQKFVANPKSFLDGGDPYAARLKEEARGAVMPNISGIDETKTSALLDMIEQESKLPKSQFAGLNIGDQPFTSVDIANGRKIILGEKHLANGGPACISCHSVDDMTLLGGGRLAPDLTKVYERMRGRKNLASWLQAPATPTMRPLFVSTSLTNDEIVSLVAYLETTARRPQQTSDTATLSFFFLGLGGSVFAFIGADTIWRKRLRGVRKPMVRGDK